MNQANHPKAAYILGAGFSKSFSPAMPLISDFKEEIIDIKNGKNGKYAFLAKFADGYYRKSSSQLDSIRDIETLATVILTKKLFVNDEEKEKYTKLRREILSLIANKISEGQDFFSPNNGLLSEFIRFAKIRKSPILTFNYDLLIENTNEWIDYAGIESYPSSMYRDMLGPPLEYLKLHGSLNWYKIKGANSINLDSVRCVDSDDRFFPIHKNDIPVFIPMAHAKDSFLTGTLFNTIWAMGVNRLVEADEIHFIGYGFPQTDLNNFFTFLDFKDKIKSIVIYGEEENLRLGKIFGKEVVKKMDAKQFLIGHMNAEQLLL